MKQRQGPVVGLAVKLASQLDCQYGPLRVQAYETRRGETMLLPGNREQAKVPAKPSVGAPIRCVGPLGYLILVLVRICRDSLFGLMWWRKKCRADARLNGSAGGTSCMTPPLSPPKSHNSRILHLPTVSDPVLTMLTHLKLFRKS